MKAAQHARSHPEHQTVDHEQEQAHGDDGHRQGQHHQDGPDDGVEQANHQRGNHGGAKTLHLNTAVDIRDPEKSRRAKKPFDEDFHAVQHSS